MPMYDYKCPLCGVVKEVKFPLPDYLLTVHCGVCPEVPEMERLPSAPNFSVKGYNAKNGYSDD